MLNSNERTIADRGYNDEKFFILPNEENMKLHKRILARHETINKRIKQFNILSVPFRNNLKRHPMVFHAILNLTQTSLENGEPLFRIY